MYDKIKSLDKSLSKSLGLLLLISLLLIYITQSAWLKSLGISALTLAIISGFLLHQFFKPWVAAHAAGLAFAKSTLLRLGIMIYGFRLSFVDIYQLGAQVIYLDMLMVFSTLGLALFLRRYFALDTKTAALIGMGSAVCGAAAVLATSASIQAKEKSVAVAVATVVVFGTLSLLLYPLLLGLWRSLAGDTAVMSQAMGLLIGSSVHEVGQVAALGNMFDEQVADTAIITKMIRVMLLLPALFVLSLYLNRQATEENRQATSATKTEENRTLKTRLLAYQAFLKHALPWFLLGFIAVIFIRSQLQLPATFLSSMCLLDQIFLTMAMFALGTSIAFHALKAMGKSAFLLAFCLWIWLMLSAGLFVFIGL